LKGLSVALTVLLPIAAVFALIGAFTAFHRASVMADLANRLFTTDVQDADDAVGAGVGSFVFVMIATAVVFMIWQFRHAKNAEQLAGRQSLSAGWAIGGWFIPAGNFVLPELQLLRSAAASDPDTPPPNGRAPGIVVAWWILFGLAGLLFLIGRVLHPSNSEVTVANLQDKADQFAAADRIMAVGLLLMIPAAIAAVLMVRQLTERQALALQRSPAQPSYQQPPQSFYPQPQQPYYPQPQQPYYQPRMQPRPWYPPPAPPPQVPPPPAPPPPPPPPPPGSTF
jgi:hypothetical protein